MKTVKAMVIIFVSIFFIPTTWASDIFETYGDVTQILLPVIAGGMAIGDKEKGDPMAFAKSFSATFLTTQALKYGLNTERPNGGSSSMPSGHTSAAFSGAAYIHTVYGWKYGVPAYLAATAVGISRLTSDNHYAQDVIVGAGIAVFYNWLFVEQSEKGENKYFLSLGEKIGVTDLMVAPISMGKDGYGVFLSFRF